MILSINDKIKLEHSYLKHVIIAHNKNINFTLMCFGFVVNSKAFKKVINNFSTILLSVSTSCDCRSLKS